MEADIRAHYYSTRGEKKRYYKQDGWIGNHKKPGKHKMDFPIPAGFGTDLFFFFVRNRFFFLGYTIDAATQ